MSNYKFFGNDITVERVNNDTNGNTRYVIHFLNVSRKLRDELGELIAHNDMYIMSVLASGKGFKKYHNRQYGGGIVFQSYNVQKDLEYLERNVLGYIEKFKKQYSK